MEESITFSNVSFGYSPALKLFDNVSFTIPHSGITAITGKSGSGKSTMLQMINGMIRPESGVIKIGNAPIDYGNVHALRLRCGYIVQQVGLFPHMTIGENIGILGRIRKLNRIEIDARISKLVTMVELPENLMKKYPYELSGGEQQRAGICRALLLNPPFLLMDEPFASLDNITRRNIYEHIRQLQDRESRTIVLVTHDWEEIHELADHFILVDHGRIVTTGDQSALQTLKESYFS